MKKFIFILTIVALLCNVVINGQGGSTESTRAKDVIKGSIINKKKNNTGISKSKRDFEIKIVESELSYSDKECGPFNRDVVPYDRPAGTFIPSIITENGSFVSVYDNNMFFGSAYSIPWQFIVPQGDENENYEWHWYNDIWSTEKDAEFYLILDDGTELPYFLPHLIYEMPKFLCKPILGRDNSLKTEN